MYMFIVREVNKSIAKTLTWCHSQSAVIGILAFNNLEIELRLWPFVIGHTPMKTISAEVRQTKVIKITYQPVKYYSLFETR